MSNFRRKEQSGKEVNFTPLYNTEKKDSLPLISSVLSLDTALPLLCADISGKLGSKNLEQTFQRCLKVNPF